MRESALRKELLQLQKVVGVPTPEPEPEQPAAEAALEAPPAQKALSKRSLAAEVAMLSGPPAAVVPQPEGGRDAAVLANGDAAEPGAVAEQASTAAGSADAVGVVPMQEDGAAAAANTGAAAAAAPEAVAAVVDPLQALKEELLAVLDWVPFDAFHRVRGSPERREQLRGVVLAAQTSKVQFIYSNLKNACSYLCTLFYRANEMPDSSGCKPLSNADLSAGCRLRCAVMCRLLLRKVAPIEALGSATLLCATTC